MEDIPKSTINAQPIRDFVSYLSGSLIVALIALIRLPVLTRYFTPAEFGVYSLVSITYTYLSIALYNWINSCLYRYYIAYRDGKRLPALFSNLGFLFLMASILLMLVTLSWYLLTPDMTYRLLVVSAFIYLLTNQLVSLFLTLYKLQGKAIRVNLFQAVQAVASFCLILLLIFDLNVQIEAIFIAQILINVLLLFVLFLQNRATEPVIGLKHLSRNVMRELMQYGLIGFVSSLGVFILVSSDRYIIALFYAMDKVGIYNQVYQIGQVSVYFLVTVFFNSITPSFTRLLTLGIDRTDSLVAYVKTFILLLLPVTFYVALFGKQVSEFLLGPAFRSGYTMIPYVVAASFLYGLTLFNETRMKFKHTYGPVARGIIFACLLNIGLNFILVPRFGYTMAALTTLVAYLFLFLYYYRSDDFAFLTDPSVRKTFTVSFNVLLLQVLIDLFFRRILHTGFNKWTTLIEGFLFAVMYMGLMIRFNQLKIRES